MTKDEARWLAGNMKSESWPEVWIEPGVYPNDRRVSYRRLPREAPHDAWRLSPVKQKNFTQAAAVGLSDPPVEELIHEEVAVCSSLRNVSPPNEFCCMPLIDGETLDLPCLYCEDEGRETLDGDPPASAVAPTATSSAPAMVTFMKRLNTL